MACSDLSHYHDYATAQAMDRHASTATEQLQGEKISGRHAHGRKPILGLLHAARNHELRATTLDLRNSSDTAGRIEWRVMAPMASTEPSTYQYAQHHAALLELAHAVIRRSFDDRAGRDIAVESYAKPLREARACFVTLRLNGLLRGCIGDLEADQSLVEDIRANTHAAAFRDARFRALSIDEFERLLVEISIHDAPIALIFCDQLELGAQLRRAPMA